MTQAESERAPGSLPRKGTTVELEIEDLAFGGRGVARASGFVVFVEGALPGESVRARIETIHPGFAEATSIDLLRPSPHRTSPPCEHYGECGGCELQHLDPAAQALAKRQQVRAILTRVGGLRDANVRETVVAGRPWAYRFRIDFDFAAGSPPNDLILGLHRKDHPSEILPIRRCLLVTDEANRLLARLASLARDLGLTAWSRRRRRGLLRRASLQEAGATREMLLTLETGRGDPPALPALAHRLTRQFPRLVGVVRREIDKQGKPVIESILSGRDHLFEEVEGDRFRVPAGAFFQPNVEANAALRREAMAAVAPREGEAILELYCGVGFMTVALKRSGAEVTAVEGSREAIEAARENTARAASGGGVRLLHGEVAALLPRLLGERPWGSLLLDPPRVGLPRAAASEIARSRLARLVYVSCDPATLARDLRILVEEGGFRLDGVSPIDLFPQTHHIECVAGLSRPAP